MKENTQKNWFVDLRIFFFLLLYPFDLFKVGEALIFFLSNVMHILRKRVDRFYCISI